VFYFSFISQVKASEIKLKQICFISVLFQFYFTCKSRFIMQSNTVSDTAVVTERPVKGDLRYTCETYIYLANCIYSYSMFCLFVAELSVHVVHCCPVFWQIKMIMITMDV